MNRRVLATLCALYLLQGTSSAFFYIALPAALREAGAPVSLIGTTFLAYLPFGLKPLWAPLLDRYGSTRTGRRRSWMLPAQAVLVPLFLMAALLNPLGDFGLMMALAFGITTSAATQNAAADAWVVERLPGDMRGWANGAQAGSHALGGLLAGGVAALHGLGGWPAMATAMAGLSAAGTLLLFLLPVDRGENAAPPAPLILPWHRLADPDIRRSLGLLMLARTGLNLPVGLVGAMGVDAGLSVGTTALIGGVGGGAATILSAALGGWLVQRFGPTRALAVGSAVCGASSLAIGVTLWRLGLAPALAVAASLHVFAAGTLVFVALHGQFMAVADPRRAATDLALLTGLELFFGLFIASLGGWIAGSVGGYAGVFGLAAVASLLAVPAALHHRQAATAMAASPGSGRP
ncbi:MFS transporter [Muricoccus radiodurans]|uniref:MFS transporter n=1 Tax=Muricoccus radiodurans TaxID=2231721 RepID=UPI003CF0E8C2